MFQDAHNFCGCPSIFQISAAFKACTKCTLLTLKFNIQLSNNTTPIKTTKTHAILFLLDLGFNCLYFAWLSALKSFNSHSEDRVDVGTGSCKDATGEASFRVVLWPAAAAWRERLELPPKDFHITLGFHDAVPWIIGMDL
jgi:hypothetical protein